VHTIYHLGAAMRGSGHDFDCGTIVGTRNIVDTALEHRGAKLIYMSSLSVLHATLSTGDRTISENWPLEPHPQLRGHYSRTKLAAEQYVTEAVQARGLPAIILRPAEVIGPGAPFITSGVAQRRNGRLVILGNGKLHVPMVYIDDLTDAIRLAEQKGPFDGSILHIVDPNSLTQNDLVRQYLSLSGEHLRVTHIPRLVVYSLACSIQLMAKASLRAAPVSVYRLRSALAPRVFDSSAAEKQLGWRPRVGVRTGLSKALAADKCVSFDTPLGKQSPRPQSRDSVVS
jgi:nucleoside-diphosphate-sugar epimerase